MGRSTIILFHCNNAQPKQAAMEQKLTRECRIRGHDVILLPHLNHLAEESNLWETLAQYPGDMMVFAWMHSRPAKWILKRHGLSPARMRIFNLHDYADADTCLAAMEMAHAENGDTSPEGRLIELHEPISPRWYPVIDESRCVNCLQCLQFCLFGVYQQTEEKRVKVHEPDQCKPGCPACSRVCPHGAIMFPMYDKDPAIAGAESAKRDTQSPARPAFDDLDMLVDEMDRMLQRRK